MNTSAETLVLDTAIAWRIRLHHNVADAKTWQAFEAWRQAAPEHAAVWERLQAMGSSLQAPLASLPGQEATYILRQAEEQQRRRSRRKALLSLGACSVGGVLAWRVAEAPFVQPLLADASTRRGERRQLNLPDGGVLVLNTDTAVNISFNAQFRRVELLRGEIYLISAYDPLERPLFVQTRDGRAQALGTRYRVRQLDSGSQVEVNEGSVALWPRQHSGDRAYTVLETGQSACMSSVRVDALPAEQQGIGSAWVEGALAVKDMPLSLFLQDLARYHGAIECDPAVAQIKVSGVFQLHDTAKILDLLRQSLPVRVEQGRQWWGGRLTRVLARA